MLTISNLTDRPVLLAFNSGQTLRLSPRSSAGEIPEVEIVNNAKVAKLTALNIITVEEAQQQRHAGGGTRGGSSKATDSDEASGRATASERPEKSAKRPE